MPITFTGVQRVPHDEDRLREAAYWATRTMEERVIAGWALAENNLIPRKNDEPEKRATFTLRRIPRSPR